MTLCAWSIMESSPLSSCMVPKYGVNMREWWKNYKLQKKALRIINFKPWKADASPLFKNCKILKLEDSVLLQNILFVHDNLNNNVPTSLSKKFKFVDTGPTRLGLLNQLKMPKTRTIIYGSKSIKSKCVENWNLVNKHIYYEKIQNKSKSVCKMIVAQFLLERYWV